MTEPVVFLDGRVSLYLGDCREIAPVLGNVDAVVTDPPYGQRQNTNVRGADGLRAVTPPGCGARAIANVRKARNVRTAGVAGSLHSSGLAIEWPEGIVGDAEPFDPAAWLGVAPRVLFWGAHRFADKLPAGSWLVWDKVPTGKIRDQGDGEAAWINDDPPRPMRLHRLLWDGVCVGSAARDEVTAGQQRVHPTQKPVVLMEWCLAQARIEPGGGDPRPLYGQRLDRRRCGQRRLSFHRDRDRAALLRHGVSSNRGSDALPDVRRVDVRSSCAAEAGGA